MLEELVLKDFKLFISICLANRIFRSVSIATTLKERLMRSYESFRQKKKILLSNLKVLEFRFLFRIRSNYFELPQTKAMIYCDLRFVSE